MSSDEAKTVSEAVKRLQRRDASLRSVDLNGKRYSDVKLSKLIDCLMVAPDALVHVFLGQNRLTDKTGERLACYLAASKTLHSLCLRDNAFTEATYRALASALAVNRSLRFLYLQNNKVEQSPRLDDAFARALSLNPHRSADSYWWLYSDVNEFQRLRQQAKSILPAAAASSSSSSLASPRAEGMRGAAAFKSLSLPPVGDAGGGDAEQTRAASTPASVGGSDERLADDRVRQLEQRLHDSEKDAAVMRTQILELRAALDAKDRLCQQLQQQLNQIISAAMSTPTPDRWQGSRLEVFQVRASQRGDDYCSTESLSVDHRYTLSEHE